MPTQKNVIFYHVATNPNDFKSFFREGAKATQTSIKKSPQGFYVWTSEMLVDDHIRALDGGFLNKDLPQHEALVLGINVSEESLKYPTWQIDEECAPGLLELLNEYTDSINKKLKNVDIPLPDGAPFLKKITAISCQKDTTQTTFTFDGKNSLGMDCPYSITCYQNQNPCQTPSDAFYLHALVDSLNHVDLNFKKDYHHWMNIMAQDHAAFKYLGKNPLPISSATHVIVDKGGNLKKTVLWDKTKGNQQVCPFLKLKNIQR